MNGNRRRRARRSCPRTPRHPAFAPREARLRMLAEHSPDIYFSMRFPEGRYEYISPTVESLFGHTQQEFYDDPATVLRCIAPDWRDTVAGWIADIAQGKVAEAYEFQALDRQGQRRWIRQRQVYMPTPDGSAWLLQGVATDITELREAQQRLRQSEEHFRQLIELWPDQVVLSVNLDAGLHEYVSPSMERVMGYAPQEFYDDPGLGMAVVAPQWRPQAEGWMRDIANGILEPSYEFELVHKNGQHRWIHQLGVLRPAEPGQDRVVHFTFRDVTDVKQAERALHESEARFRALAESWTEHIIARFNLLENRYEYVSPSVTQIFGYAPEEFYRATRPLAEFVTPEWRQTVIEWLGELRQGILRKEYEYEVLNAWGQRRWVLQRCTLLHDAEGRPAMLQSLLFDNTERRRLEDALRESNRQHALLSDNLVDIVWALDQELRWTYLSPSATALLGYPLERMYGLRFPDLFTTESLAIVDQAVLAWSAALPGSPEDCPRTLDLTMFHASEEWVPVEVLARPLRDAAGRISGYCGTARDVRPRKRLERIETALSRLARELLECEELDQALELAAACAREITGAAQVFVFHRDPDSGLLQGPGGQRMGPLPAGALCVPVLHAGEEVGRLAALAASPAQAVDPAEARHLLERAAGLLALAMTRIRAQEALRRSEHLSRLLLESMHEGVWAVDRDQKTIFVNEHLAAMLGYSVAELSQMHLLDVLDAPQRQLALERMQERRLGRPGSNDYEPFRRDGSRLPMHVSASPILDENGVFEGLVCTAVDLTERKHMEEELRRNQARFEALFELSRLTSATEAQMAAFTLREALRLTGSSSGVLFFVNAARTELVPLAWRGAPENLRIPPFPLSGSNPWATVHATRQPVILNDYKLFGSHLPKEHQPVERFLGVPALDGELPAAILGVSGKKGGYSADDSMQVSLLMDGMWRIVRARRDEARIRASLREKESLLREVHHRVKNNLQVVSSLLDMAGRRLPDAQARRSMEEVRAKVQAMSLVHTQLHRGAVADDPGVGPGGGIDLERYVRALFQQLREIYTGGMELGMHVRLDELSLGLDQAAPLGLALNEVLANVFKHGRRQDRPGKVDVRAWQEPGGLVRIEVRDDGPGLPEGFVPERARSLGLKLLLGLVRTQLGGEVELASGPEGLCVGISFRPDIAQ